MSAAASARISSASGGTKHSTRSQATIAKALVAGENARPPPPHYRVFRCDWVDCGAELHNLETLKKHVYKVHMERVKRHCKWKGGQKTDPLAHDEPQSSKRRCGWKDCQKADSLELDELRSHFEQEHAYPYAMELGDGPSSIGNGHYESIKDKIVSKSFLLDKRGRVITPEAGPNPDDTPALIFPAPPMAVRDFNVLHNNTSRQQKCQAVIDALAAKKLSSGISMTKEGCTFMNFDRLQTVAAFEVVYETFEETQA